MQSLTAEDKKELCKDAFQDISSILAHSKKNITQKYIQLSIYLNLIKFI